MSTKYTIRNDLLLKKDIHEFDVASNIFDELSSEMEKFADEVLLEAFKHYGYDKKWVLTNRHRISTWRGYGADGFDHTLYLLDDTPIFEIFTEIKQGVNIEGRYKLNFVSSIKYYQEVKVNEENKRCNYC